MSISTNQLGPEEYRAHALQEFIRYRDTYTDELPAKRIVPEDPKYALYRCRTNFFSGVYTRINLLISQGHLPDEFSTFSDYMERDRDWHEPATPYDLEIINGVIRDVIRLLEIPLSTPVL